MAGLAMDGSNPDVDVLDGINGLAKDAPHWLNRAMEYLGEYGIIAGLAVLCLIAWWGARKRPDAPSAVAGLVWAPLAAGMALLANIPIRAVVERPRPFKGHAGLEVLIPGKSDFSFVSDHATLTMAVGVGLFIAHRKYGLIGIALALLEGFCRVYMGVHYPTDVIGGFALGTAMALLLAPVALALLVPVTTAVSRSPGWWLVRAGGPAARPVSGPVTAVPPVSHTERDEDLAA
ncbi:membrane protein [Streptomyces rimosus]|uniref:phosphatase PAP2 family protein n=1 Tax=Streptomyces rimosus TaxID=1927 RepID=UPI0004D3767C|nr:phosphatase PAP2 family protein [Streptomyces rimosus]KEF02756.1 membrane protein [Streptomyces rimosus]